MTVYAKETIRILVLNKDKSVLKTLEARKGSLLWAQLRKAHFPVGAACSGVGVCGACDVFIESPVPLDGATVFENEVLDRNRKRQGARLSCLVRVWTDVTVWSDRF